MFRRALIALLVMLPGVAIAQDARKPDEPPPPQPTGVVTKAPVLLQAVAPVYPPKALEEGRQADVPVRLHIDENGVVTQVDVITPQGYGFDEAAVEAAMQYVFDPAEIDGQPGAIQVETTIHFVIEIVEEPDEPDEPDVTPEGEADWPEAPPGHAGDPRKPITLQGEAVERGTRRKLSGIIVSVVELGLDTITDDDGNFYFHGIGPGDWTLLAVDDRFDRFKRQIELFKGEVLEARLWMNPTGGNPYETIVEGEREVFEVTRRTLQRRQLMTVPGTFGDPIRVIQTLPGLARPPFGLGLLIVRGSNPDDTGIFLDGHRIPLLFHFLGGPSILSAELIETLDLYPSGFPARFGRAHGGVVALETRPSKSDGIHGSADIDLLDAGGYVRAPINKKMSIAVAGRRSYIDQLLPYVLPEPSPGSTRIVVPVYYDAQARFDYDLGDEGRLSLFAITSSDKLDVLTKDEEDEVDLGLNTQTRFFRLIATYKRPLIRKLDLTISPAWGRDSITLAAGASDAQSPYLSLSATQTTMSYRARVFGALTDHLVLDAGLDIDSRVNEYDALVPDDTGIRGGQGIDIPPSLVRVSTESLGVAVHGDLAIDVGNLRVIPGLRLDGYVIAAQSRSSVDPRISARYKTSPDWTVKGYVGRFSQPPQPEALDPMFGNPALGTEHAYHFGIGAEWKPTRLWNADAEVYYIDRRDLVGFTDDLGMTDDGEVDPLYFKNGGHGFTYGFELMIKREITDKLFGWMSYTFSHSERALPDRRLVPSAFDQTHVMNAVASWRPGGGWELGARWQLATGRPDTPVVDAGFDADSGGYFSVDGDSRSTRIPFFNQVDVRAEKTWLFDTWSLGLYVDVMNVLNHANVEAYEFDYRFRETAPVTGIPIVPTLGIRGTW